VLLYLHIPFCDSKCHYCAFVSSTHHHHLRDAYTEALLQDLARSLQSAPAIETLYIGGGTPSTLPLSHFERIFSLLEPHLKKCREITIEANPTATKEWLEGMSRFADRISFGVQSFDEEKLRFLGRSHTPRQAIEAVETAAKAGFRRISIDLIYECAVDSVELLGRDIDTALALPIEHISAYSLTIEEGTAFARQPQRRKEDERLAAFVRERIGKRFLQYEASNYGEPSLHNLGYWKLRPYIGVGCGAVGFDGRRRLYAPERIEAYIKDPHVRTVETLSNADLRTEKIFLGLRSCVGVEAGLVDAKKAQILIEAQKLTQKGGRLYATDYFLADELALFLL
jgi:oxygen-independent coproporphyrinogen-3 oxidase